MKKKTGLLSFILLFVVGCICAQEFETHIISDPARAADLKLRLERIENSVGEKSAISLPFMDDFSQDHFPGNEDGNQVLWEELDAHQNWGFGIDPPSVGVVTLDGLNSAGLPHDPSSASSLGHGDSLTSVEIDLLGAENVVFSFFFQPQGNGEAPDGPDSLSLSFYSPSTGWNRVWHRLGTIVQPFEQVLMEVDSAYLTSEFKFRFINYGGLSGSVDIWNLDWIWLDQNRTTSDSLLNDVGFQRNEFSLLEQGFSSVPWSHYQDQPNALMSDVRPILLRNNRELGAFINSTGYSVSYEGSPLASFLDPQTPSIAGMSDEEVIQEIDFAPNNFIYDPFINDTCAAFTVTYEFTTSPDINPDNNSHTFTQTLHDHYSYDDGQAERGYSVSGTSSAKVAFLYDILKADSMKGIQMYLLPVGENIEDEVVFMRVWENNGGVPGDLIYEDLSSRDMQYSSLNEPVFFEFDSAIFIPQGTVFIGFGQTSVIGNILPLNVGNDKNTNANSGRLFFDDGDGWTPSIISGSLMMHPVFKTLEDNILSLPESRELHGTKVWPIPATDLLNISMPNQSKYTFELTDIMGKTVRKGTKEGTRYTLYTSGLPEGSYVLLVTDLNDGRIAHHKVMISG